MQPAGSALSERSRDLLVEHYPLARSVAARAHRRLPAGVQLDDLVSVAVMGLMEACGRYDPSRGVAFRTFAKHRMHGAILDSLRAGAWIPRSVRSRVGAVDATTQRLATELGRAPTTDEVAARLDLSVEQVRSARNADTRTMLSLDAAAGHDDDSALVDLVPAAEDHPDTTMERREALDLTLAALATLPERERLAVELFYLRSTPLKQVGAALGVSESRACQICSQATKRLRTRLAPDLG